MGKDFVPLFVMWELARAKLPNAMIVKKKENKQ